MATAKETLEPVIYARPGPLCLIRHGLRGSRIFCTRLEHHHGNHGARDRSGQIVVWSDREAGIV